MRARLTIASLLFSASAALAGGQSAPPRMIDEFHAVVARIEPVAERECLRRTNGLNCDFHFVLDRRGSAGANATYRLDPTGRPVIRITARLLDKLRSADEVAFVLSHEAGHHLGGHTLRMRNAAVGTDVKYATMGVAAVGLNGKAQRRAFELEADAFGAVIARRAGFDAAQGARCIARMIGPGHGRNADHPAHEERLAVVNQVLKR